MGWYLHRISPQKREAGYYSASVVQTGQDEEIRRGCDSGSGKSSPKGCGNSD
jgi:hypothetical protein